jgi:hypothetical protein
MRFGGRATKTGCFGAARLICHIGSSYHWLRQTPGASIQQARLISYQAMENRMPRSRLIVSSLMAVAVVVVVWLWFFPPRWWLNVTKPVDLADPVGAGKALVEKYDCRRCHFIGEEGKAKGPALPNVTARLDAVSLRLWLRDPGSIKGDTSMPNFRLSDGEIEAIVFYLTALDNDGS